MSSTEESSNKISYYHPAFLIATWFGIGKIPFAPGTFGSLFTFPLFILSHYLLCFASDESSFNYLYLLFIFLLFLAGQWASSVYMKKTNTKDPGEIVIDEVVGQLIVFFAAFSVFAPFIGVYDVLYGPTVDDTTQHVTLESLYEFFSSQAILLSYLVTILPACFVGFILFRIFDIWKPFPIRWCDKNIKGGFGVMFDDVFAAIYASIALYAVILIFFMYFVQPEAPISPDLEIVE